MALIPPKFLDCVVAIGFGNDGEETHYCATGFLYAKRVSTDEPIYSYALVTNKHVFDGHRKARIRFNQKGSEDAKEFGIELCDDGGQPYWATDPEVDLAVIAFRPDMLVEHNIQFSAFRSDRDILTLEAAHNAGISEGDGVFALGFPLGLVGEQRNYVIVRQGVIARIRDAFEGANSEILMDMTIFPGNSGGPVLTRPEITAIQGTMPFGRSALIGVVSAYLPYEDVAVSVQTGHQRIVFHENSGLAVVVPIEHVMKLFDQNVEEWHRRGVATVDIPKEKAVMPA